MYDPQHPAVEEDEPLVISDGMLHPEVDFERGINLVPVCTLALMLACAVAFVGEVLRGALDNLDGLVAVGALSPPEVARGEVWRLVSAMFLHGSFEHLFGNLVMLYILGVACEHAYGRAQFLTLYVFAGVAGSLLSLTGEHVSVGASGAIFGLGGALVVFFGRHRHRLHVRDKRIGFVLGMWALYQIVLGSTVPGIDNLAHFGGLLGGAALGLVLRPALLDGRETVAAHPVTRAGAVVALSCLAVAASFMTPRLF